MHTKLAETEVAAGLLNGSDLARAKEIAAKYVITRLGKRLPEDRRISLLRQAADTIGIHRQPPTSSSPKQPHDQNGWKTVGSPRHQPGHILPTLTASVSKKRPASSPDQIQVSNRFQTLSDTEETNNMENDDDLIEIVPPQQPPQVKKLKHSAFTRTTDSGVCIYTGNKHDWIIEPKDDTTTVVIGDSNLKGITSIPTNWEVHSLPGARLSHVIGAISRMETILKPVSVIIQVGINHRSRVDVSTDEELRELMAEVQLNSSIEHVFFVGTSIPTTLPQDEADNVRAFNHKVRGCVHESNYIKPLDDHDVVINSNDISGIHYTPRTADKIMKNIETYVSESIFH